MVWQRAVLPSTPHVARCRTSRSTRKKPWLAGNNSVLEFARVGDVKVNGASPVASPPQVMRKLRWAGIGVRAMFADGHGAYLIAMIAFGAAATFLHHALRPERQYREALAELLNYQREPFRGESRPVLASGLLPDVGGWDLCKDRELLRTTDQIAERFEADLAAPPADGDQLAPCTATGCPVATQGVGRAWTDGARESTLFVPSTAADLVRRDPRAVARLLASRSLEHYRDRLNHEFAAGRLTTMYFVALSGAIRISPVLDLSGTPAHVTFAGASYMSKALSGASPLCPAVGRPRVQTLPYLDTYKFGLVRTLCQLISVAGAPGAPRDVAGVLCFDFAPPEAVVYAMLDAGARLFDLELVRFYGGGGAERCAAIDGCRPSLRNLESDELDELERKWQPPAAGTPSGISGIRMLGNGEYFGVRIDHRDKTLHNTTLDNTTLDNNEYDTVVFGRVRRSQTREITSVFAMLLFAAIAAGVIVRGVRRKGRRMEFPLIRGLQVGVVELDARDVIIGANDRAEEILGMELPSFGGSGDPVRFSSRIEPARIVRLTDAGLLPEGPVTFCRYDHDELRCPGSSRTYYAFTRGTQRLMRISSSTFVNAHGEIHTFGTIDTYLDEAHEERVLAARAAAPVAERSAAGGRRR